VYSEDEEVACTDFTNDFYKLVSIRSNSSRSLFSYLEGETDDEDEDEEDEDGQDSSMSESQTKARLSPTPSEAGRAQLTSCSSSESEEHSVTHPPQLQPQHQEQDQEQKKEEEEDHDYAVIEECRRRVNDIEIEDVPLIQAAPPAPIGNGRLEHVAGGAGCDNLRR